MPSLIHDEPNTTPTRSTERRGEDLTALTRGYAAALEHQNLAAASFKRVLEEEVRGLLPAWDTTFPKGRATVIAVLSTVWPQHAEGSTELHVSVSRTLSVVLRKLEQEGVLASTCSGGVTRYSRGVAA